MKLRIAARALILENNKILFSKCKDNNGVFYTLPGGGIEANELATKAVIRECLEETGYSVEVLDLVLVKEFMKKMPHVEIFKDGLHQIELVFLCKLDTSKQKQEATQTDSYQIGMEWLSEAEIKNERVFPTQNIFEYTKVKNKLEIYLGSREDN